MLRHCSFRDRRDKLSEEEKTCDQFDLDINCDDLENLINNKDGVSVNVIDELEEIADKADSKGNELDVASFLKTNPPAEFFL